MSDITNTAVKAMVVLRKAYRTIDAKTSESFKEDDLTQTQFGVLDVLYSKGPMKIGELMDSILATSGNMTVVIRNMEKKGWVERNRSKQDERVLNIAITDTGEALKERAVHVPEQMAKCLKLEPDEAMQLYKTLNKILDNL